MPLMIHAPLTSTFTLTLSCDLPYLPGRGSTHLPPQYARNIHCVSLRISNPDSTAHMP